MCNEDCLNMGYRVKIGAGNVMAAIGYQDGQPFSAIICDARGREHLHFPYDEVAEFVKLASKAGAFDE